LTLLTHFQNHTIQRDRPNKRPQLQQKHSSNHPMLLQDIHTTAHDLPSSFADVLLGNLNTSNPLEATPSASHHFF
jgi:hypothetical protein